MNGFYKYRTEDGEERVCVAAQIAMYDTLCGNDLFDEGHTATDVVALDKAAVTCPHCLEVINAVLDLPQFAKRQARKKQGRG